MKATLQILLLSVACFVGKTTAVAAPPAAGKESVQLVADGNNFMSRGQPVEALWAYGQAAKAGNVDGAYAAGDLMLRQAMNNTGRERILKAHRGIQYLFFAATNHHAQACVRLSEALQNGTGVQTNLPAAYAWLKLASQFDNTLKPNLDRLVVWLEPGEVSQAQELAHEFQIGHWPAGVARPVDEGDPRLMVQGITIGNHGPLVVVNNATLAPGDTAEVRPASGLKNTASEKLTITCREAGADYVLVAVAGETNLKLLSTEQLSRY